MAFLRKIRISGHDYAHVVENYRDSAGHVRQRIVRHLGPLAPIYRRHGRVDFEGLKAMAKKSRLQRVQVDELA